MTIVNDTYTNINIIPKEIINLCLLFYVMRYKFDPKWKNESMILSDNNTKVTMPKSSQRSGSVYCIDTISDGIHEIKFKIISMTGDMCIGIWHGSIDSFGNRYYDPPIDMSWTVWMHKGYDYRITHGITSKANGAYGDAYGQGVKSGDIITMIVDFGSLTLSYNCNDKDLGIAYNIDAGKYKVGVYMDSNSRHDIIGDGVVEILYM